MIKKKIINLNKKFPENNIELEKVKGNLSDGVKNFPIQHSGKIVNLSGKYLQTNSEQENAVNENSLINADLKDSAKWSFINDKLRVILLELGLVQDKNMTYPGDNLS